MANFYKTPLITKLGFDRLDRVVTIAAPKNYRRLLGRSKINIQTGFPKELIKGIHWFVKSRVVLEKKFPTVQRHLAKDGILWVSWPKKTSRIKHDVGERIVHETGLANGLVDVKVAAIDADWSGFKFVYRLKDRRP